MILRKTGISLHWSAGQYLPNVCDLQSYHGGVTLEHPEVSNYEKFNDYEKVLPHTWRRNFELIGLTVCGMVGATTADFGTCPLRAGQIEELCLATAEILEIYRAKGRIIPTEKVRTHAEWALEDGYGPGSGDSQTKWDLALFKPGNCTKTTTLKCGDALRGKISWYRQQIIDGEKQIRELHYKNKIQGGVPQ